MITIFAENQLPLGFPQIIQNPGMKVVEKGRNAVLVCDSTGEPTPTISWVKDTIPINVEVRSVRNDRAVMFGLTVIEHGKKI